MKITISAFWLFMSLTGCSQPNGGQSIPDRVVGGGCDGCELMYEQIPSTMSWKTIIAAAGEAGERMTIRGMIYSLDGKPAPGVILYVYHTDSKGYYSPAPGQVAAKRHGHLRGWMRTDENGRYQFTSIRPAPYPDRKIPAHIHAIVKEAGLTEYYIDEYLFDDDPLVTGKEKANQENRGGQGIVHLVRNSQGEWTGTRDITLGLNVPDYSGR